MKMPRPQGEQCKVTYKLLPWYVASGFSGTPILIYSSDRAGMRRLYALIVSIPNIKQEILTGKVRYSEYGTGVGVY